jgi:uncharacterized protein YbcV (DUF1398 family)
MSDKDRLTMLEICKQVDFDDVEIFSHEDLSVLIDGLKELVKIAPVKAINSAIVLAKSMHVFMIGGDDRQNAMEEIVFPNLERILDHDVNEVRNTFAKTIAYVADYYRNHIFDDANPIDISTIKSLVPVFQSLSRTPGQEIETRQLADFLVGKFMDVKYEIGEAENSLDGIRDIMPFTTAGQIAISANGTNRQNPKNEK